MLHLVTPSTAPGRKGRTCSVPSNAHFVFPFLPYRCSPKRRFQVETPASWMAATRQPSNEAPVSCPGRLSLWIPSVHGRTAWHRHSPIPATVEQFLTIPKIVQSPLPIATLSNLWCSADIIWRPFVKNKSDHSFSLTSVDKFSLFIVSFPPAPRAADWQAHSVRVLTFLSSPARLVVCQRTVQ